MGKLSGSLKRVPILGQLLVALGDARRRWRGHGPRDAGLAQLKASQHPAAGRLLEALAMARRKGPPAIRRIESRRAALLGVDALLDDGSLPASLRRDREVRVCEAVRASMPPRQAALLHGLVKVFGLRAALELGTNVGISAAYIAAAAAPGTVTTLERSHHRARHARALFDAVGLDNVDIVLGSFDQTLAGVLNRSGVLDFAFIDGNHRLEPTLRYFEAIIAHMRPGGVVVFDDIRWSQGMREAWERIRGDDRFSLTADLVRMGVGVVRLGAEAAERIDEHGGWLEGPGPKIHVP